MSVYYILDAPLEPGADNINTSRTYVVLKSAQLLLVEEVEEEACPGAGGGVLIGCWAEVGVTEAAARRLIGASFSGIRSA